MTRTARAASFVQRRHVDLGRVASAACRA
ncbi:putative leader peptide [Kineococcus gypseus]